MVPNERLTDRFDDRHATRSRGLVKDGHLVFCGCRKNFYAVFRQQRLVAGHHDLAVFDGPQDQLQRSFDSADEFHDHLDRGIVDQILPAFGEQLPGGGHGAGLGHVAHGDFFHHEFQPEAFHEQYTIFRQVFINTRSHVPHAC